MANEAQGKNATAAAAEITMTNTPAQTAATMLAAMTGKAGLPLAKMFLLALMAGAFIAIGAEAANIAAHNITQTGVQRLVMGCIFPVGLIMVVLLGAELFTGNCMMIAPLCDKRIKAAGLLRNWVVVYLGNFVGAMIVVVLVNLSGQLGYSEGGLAALTMKIAVTKSSLDPFTAFASGIMCNVLVCIAVLLAMSSKTVMGKIAGIWFPIMTFVLSGFEHCVANMYYIPAGILAAANPSYAAAASAAGVSLDALTFAGFAANLVPVTLGNIVGGCVVALLMWYCHGRAKKVG